MKKYYLVLNYITLIATDYIITLFKPDNIFQTVVQYVALISVLLTFVLFNKLIVKSMNIKQLPTIYAVLPFILILIALVTPIIILFK